MARLKYDKKSIASDAQALQRKHSSMKAMAISNAFDTFGSDMKKLLLYHLDKEHEIANSESAESISLSKLRSALDKILGKGGSMLIMERIYVELDKQAATSSKK